ncbi:uncharacterized protein LOC124157050 isoform X2 [Ischnura elegans]|uniref:uncharacterized protein LOC124157050 isoform X2 n=1 Tax=Ischnura elegans TaxID=197161 RepID=UPI001ED88478|nr:uncharacterized protein LOC124157050 isoform X2 [Ischnura elegans]
MSKFRLAENNFVDETILGTPLPEATSTVNNKADRHPSIASLPSDQRIKRASSSRLTGTIDHLKTLSEAIASVRRTPDGQDHSLLSVTDVSFDKIPSNASLGVLDVDALLGNEQLDNSQEIMEKLYKSQQRRKSPGKCKSGKISEFSHQKSMSSKISFDPCEVSARSTSLGMSSTNSNSSNASSERISWNNMDNADMVGVDENFISDESGVLKALEKDEKSFLADFLPPIDSDNIPDSNLTRLSAFSEVHDGEKIMVRPSWIGLEGNNDDPINISVGQYFRIKTDVLPRSSNVYLTPDQRPNFGMKITSPKRREKGIPLVADTWSESVPGTPRDLGCDSKQNNTQVITPKEATHCSPTGKIDADDKSPEIIIENSVSIPSLSHIDKILKQINVSDTPNTMANKFLRYSTPSNLGERDIEEQFVGTTPKRDVIERNLEDSKMLNGSKKSGLKTPKIVLGEESDKENVRRLTYARMSSTKPKEPKNVKREIPDLLKKLNSLERRGKNDKSALKNVSNIVDKLKSNVAGPLDCSALYETLNSDVIMEGPLNCDKPENVSELQREAVMAQECNGSKPWVEIPEEILIAGENELPQNLCVGLGFSTFVPIVNLTNNWLIYQAHPLKKSSDKEIIFQQLPIRTLLAPGSHAEFEVIIAPMRAGRHSVELEVNVTNFMAEANAPNQTYHTRLTLNSSTPKVVLISDGMNELKDGETLNFGMLPEKCSDKISLHLLNAGKNDIPIRIVIDEMPEAYQPFRICSASRLSRNNDGIHCEMGAEELHQNGINLERKDLLSCDLSGSGPNSMVTFALYFHAPGISAKSHTANNEMQQLSAKLKVELDVPINSSSELTVLKEVGLFGCVGMTKLEVGIEGDLLILNSKEKNIVPQSTDGRCATSMHHQSSASIYPPVSQLVPISNQGVVPLDITVCITLPNDDNIEDSNDEMTVVPDSLNLQPGERSSFSISYHPKTDTGYKCNRTLCLRLNPNGPMIRYNLQGVCVPLKISNSWMVEGAKKAIQPEEMRVEETNPSLDSTPHIIQATRTALVWGCSPLNKEYSKSSFMLRNPTKVLEKVSLTITGSEDYKLLNNESEVVRKTSFHLLPEQSQLVRVFFRPKKVGPSVGKLEITVHDGRETNRKIASKMMSLYGYGGFSKIEVIALPKDMAGRPWLNLGLIFSHSSGPGALDFSTPMKSNTSRSSSPSQSTPSLKSRLLIHNAGSLAAYVKIIPLKVGVESDSLSNLEEGREHFVTVRPDAFQLEPLTGINVWVSYVHGLSNNASANESSRDPSNRGERALEEVAKLLILSGEVVTRARLRKIYKTAEVIHAKKDIGKFLSHNGESLSFIGVESKEGVVSELEDSPDGDGEDSQVTSLCDPATKDAVQSLVQNMKSMEVLLAVEKEIGGKESENDANATLIAQGQGNESFHPLMDDQDASPCVNRNFSFLYPDQSSVDATLCPKMWSIEPEGTVCLGSSHGPSSTLILRSHSNSSIIFEIRLGLMESDGRLKWIPPSHRQSQAGGNLLMVEPWQGQLMPFGSVPLKLFLQRESQYPLLNGVMQVYSENDSLKVNVQIKGNGQHALPKSSVFNRGFVMNDASKMGLIKQLNAGNKAMPSRKDQDKAEKLPLRKNGNKINSIYLESNKITFPVIKVHSLIYEKLVVNNPTDETYKVSMFGASDPFIVPLEIGNVKDHSFKAYRIGFFPLSPGSYEQIVTLNVVSLSSSKSQNIRVTLFGRAVP